MSERSMLEPIGRRRRRSTGPRFRITLAAAAADPAGPGAEQRLKLGLKVLLRSFKLRCVLIETIHTEEGTTR